MHPDDLDSLVSRALDELPHPRAPHTLLPRVLEAARLARRPWYSRAWLTWPLYWQVASVALLGAVTATIAFLPGLGALLAEVPAGLAPGAETPAALAMARVTEVLGRVEAIGVVVRVLARSVLAPMMTLGLLLVALMCLSCAVYGAALSRLACGKVQP